jgi:putative phosphoesterase
MMRHVAVLSDVHAVLPVLEAVLAEPDVANADLIVVTGDHATGPQPVEVLDRLTSLGSRVLLVRGNCDRDLVSLARGVDTTPVPEVSAWAAAQLTDRHIDLLDGLPHPVTVQVEGFGQVVFCHGTPRDDDEVVLVDTRLERWAEAFADLPPEVTTVVCGHTHMPFIRLVDRRLVVNPGSIGMPYGSSGGNWALMKDGAVTLRRTIIDLDEAVADVVRGSTYPDRQNWADEYIRAVHSDAEALTVFAARDGRTTAAPAASADPTGAHPAGERP